MHSENEELLQGHSGHAWLGSTPRPDAETDTHEMHGWGILPGRTPRPTPTRCRAGEYSPAQPLVLLGWLPPLATLLTRYTHEMHGWGVLPGRTLRPTPTRCRAGEYSPAHLYSWAGYFL